MSHQRLQSFQFDSMSDWHLRGLEFGLRETRALAKIHLVDEGLETQQDFWADMMSVIPCYINRI